MLLAMALSLTLLMLLGLPLWLVFLVTSAVAIHFYLPVSPLVITSTMFGALSNWLMLAVPGFIFAGELLTQSGMAVGLARWVRVLTGGLPGGVPVTTVVASEMFGSMSGSSAAATAAIGKVLYPGLREQGYPEKFSLGLIASCGALATLIPPSINMILYASVVNASVGQLFVAGIVPGLLIGLLLIAYIIGYSLRCGIGRPERPDWATFGRQTLQAAWPLGVPVLILGGIYTGVFTPTESAALSALYALVVGTLALRALTVKQLLAATLSAAHLTAKIFIIVASSSVFAWVLTVARVPRLLVELVQVMEPPSWLVLVLINLVLLVAGMFIDPTSAVVVLSPMLWPLARAIGLDPIHFGVIVVLNLGIGMFTPPFGLNIFVASSVLRVPATRVTAGLVPFAAIYLVALGLVTYLPGLSLWLTRTLSP